jgi:hypothetical protein
MPSQTMSANAFAGGPRRGLPRAGSPARVLCVMGCGWGGRSPTRARGGAAFASFRLRKCFGGAPQREARRLVGEPGHSGTRRPAAPRCNEWRFCDEARKTKHRFDHGRGDGRRRTLVIVMLWPEIWAGALLNRRE